MTRMGPLQTGFYDLARRGDRALLYVWQFVAARLLLSAMPDDARSGFADLEPSAAAKAKADAWARLEHEYAATRKGSRR